MKRNVLLDCTFGARIAVARMSVAMMSLLLALLLGLMLGPALCAQQQPNVDNGVKMYGSYDGSEIDTVNLQNGNLMLHIAPPLSYPQRGKLDSHMLLSITSKNWTVGSDGTSQFWHLGPSPAGGVAVIGRGMGFSSSLDLTVHRGYEYLGSTSTVSTFAYYISTWDGGVHQLTSATNAPLNSNGTASSFDTIDGSGYHLVLSSDLDAMGAPKSAVVIDRTGNRYAVGRFAGACGHTNSGEYVGPKDGTPSTLQELMFESGSAGLFFSAQLDALNTPASNPGSGIYHVKMDPRTLIEQVGFVDGTSEIYCQQTGRITSVTDVNGNTINTFWSTAPADTLGRLPDVFTDVADTTDYTSGCVNPSPAIPTTRAAVASYVGYGGLTYQIKMCMATFPIQTNFGVPGIIEYQNETTGQGRLTSLELLTTIIFADAPNWTGTRWTFNYTGALEISDVGLPTGGRIHYDWTTIRQPNCQTATPVSPAVAQRTVYDENGHAFTTKYNWGATSNGVVTNTATNPLNNDTMHTFTALDGNQGCQFFETSERTYQGSSQTGSLVKQVDTAYSPTILYTNNGGGDGGYGNIFPVSIKTTLQNGKVNLVTRSIDPGPGNGLPSSGNVAQEKVYDWGQGAPGPLLRETDHFYQWRADTSGAYLAANLIDPPYGVAVKDRNGCLVSFATSGYDETQVNPSGLGPAQNLNPAPGVRGNQTSVSRWVAELSSGTCVSLGVNSQGVPTPPSPAVTSHVAWYDSGQPKQEIDPLVHTTTHSYDPFYVGAYSTQTCNALNQCLSATYDYTTGLLTSYTDPNGATQASGNTPGDPAHTSNYTYDMMNRLTSGQTPPDPGNGSNRANTAFAFSDPSKFPLTVTTSKSITATTSTSSTTQFDGLGRIYKTQHVTPECSDGITVDTTFDSAGHPSSVTNPYCHTTDPLYGVVRTAYDALNRVTQITKQDGGVSTMDYSEGNCISAADEAGLKRRTCMDGLGQLVEVDEPNLHAPATQATGSVNITGAEQAAGGQSAQPGSVASWPRWHSVSHI